MVFCPRGLKTQHHATVPQPLISYDARCSRPSHKLYIAMLVRPAALSARRIKRNALSVQKMMRDFAQARRSVGGGVVAFARATVLDHARRVIE